MNHISQGPISSIKKTDLTKLNRHELLSWLLLSENEALQKELPEFRMKNNLFTI